MIVVASLSSPLVGCGGDDSKRSKEPTPFTKVPPQDDEGDDVDDRGKSWGGWRWGGDRDDCYYVYKNRCFKKLKKACRAAKCGKKNCKHTDAAPAKVTCNRKKK
jgi:hypothetical protein